MHSYKDLSLSRMIITIAVIGIILSCKLPFSLPFQKKTDAEQDPQVIALSDLQDASDLTLEVSFEKGFPQSVIGSVPVSGEDPLTQAMNYLNKYDNLYYLNAPNFDLKLRRIDGEEQKIVVFYQTYQSIPVYAAEIVVYLSGNNVIATSGNLLHDLQLKIEPMIPLQQAKQIAREAMDMPEDVVVIGEPSLTIFDMHLLDNSKASDPRLAWHVSFGTKEGPIAFVDAHTGEMLYSFITAHYFNFDLSDAHGHSALHDCYMFTPQDRDIGDENGIFEDDYLNDQIAVDAWQLGHDVYWYYITRFGRAGFNGNDYELEIHIHAEISGLPAAYYEVCHSIDLSDNAVDLYHLAHEYTHGVIDFTSDLKYNNHPGALSEFFAYVIGALAEYEEKGYSGEFERLGRHTRDHISKYLPGSNDNGEVHENAWIPGRAAFLITAGGEHYGYKIKGIGPQKMGDLFYHVMISLPTHASFEVMANAAVARAISWVGSGGWTQDDVCQVRNAFVSVGILEYGDADCDGIPNIYEGDADNDFIMDVNDNCPYAANPTQADNDGDGKGDMCDPDDDGDGILDFEDNCQWISNPYQHNADATDGDRFGDACEDTDYDNVIDYDDNCQIDPNPDQLDTDGDGFGDACDVDDDGDGLLDTLDPCPLIWQDSNNQGVDTDGDGIGNACDNCQHVPNPDQINTDGIGRGDACDYDDDEDGIEDIYDNCPLVYNPNQIDLDNDGIGFLCDEDEEPILLMDEFQGSFNASAGDYFNIHIPYCVDYGNSPNLQVETSIAGLPDDIAVWVTNQFGEMVSKPGDQSGTREMIFNHVGGDDYLLTFYVSPTRSDTIESSFNLNSSCNPASQMDVQSESEEPSQEPTTPPEPQDTEPVLVPTNTPVQPTLPPPTAIPTKTNTPVPPQNGWISGQVWKDQNSNGVKDKGEEWYSGVTVQLGSGACGSSGYATATTDSSGTFRFNDIPLGTYCVSVEIQETCGTYSIPKTPTKKTITVPPGSGAYAGLFGFAPYIC